MSYNMYQRGADFRIKAGSKLLALGAIKAYGRQEIELSNFSGRRDFMESKTLEEAMSSFRWEVEVDPETQDIVDIHFESGKASDDDELFESIAPYVVAGSYIEMQGEGDELWRWHFRDGQVFTIKPMISWTDE